MKKYFISISLFLSFSSLNTIAGEYIRPIPLSDVRITAGPFYDAQQTNLHYLLTMDSERLLAPYRREANLPVHVENYPNWENTGLDGHIGGHYLTALSLAYAATGNQQVLARLTYMIDELAKCQNQHGNGYLGGVPDSARIWEEIAKGQIEADLFTLNKSWVPWYNLHKVFSGLRDAYLYTGSEQAKNMLVEFSDWMLTLSNKLNDNQLQTMLRTEYGGLNETLADVYQITGKAKYLALAKRYTEMKLLTPLMDKKDELNGLHANTQIPKIVGVARIAHLNNDERWLDSADFFWQQVVGNRTVSIGGNSVREHFHPSDDFSSMVKDVEGPETCNTYNMLKLSKLLYQAKGELPYIDYYERALYNHILSSQHPVHGGLVYFTPMRPNHYRVYSEPTQSMWCCVGSGIENHSKYGEMVYAETDGAFFINLFINSRVIWQQQSVKLSQKTNFPDSETTKITIHDKGEFELNIRVPSWVNGPVTLKLNGSKVQTETHVGKYIKLNRQWHKGDVIELRLPMQTILEQLPDNSNYYSVIHGPIVLATKAQPFANEQLQFIADDSRMGHIAQGPVCDLTDAPIFTSERQDILKSIKKVDNDELLFIVNDKATNQNKPLELVPFFRLHDSRYTLYFPQFSRMEWQQHEKQIIGQQQREKALAAQTLDFIAPGEQQPEADHFFESKRSEAGVNGTRHWRHASDWFSYRLNNKGEKNTILRLTYFGLDADRTFDILINDKHLSTVKLKGDKGAEFFSVDYSIPSQLLDNESNYFRVKFKAHPESLAGGLYGIRLLKQ